MSQNSWNLTQKPGKTSGVVVEKQVVVGGDYKWEGQMQSQQHHHVDLANGDGFQIVQKQTHHQHDIDFCDPNGFQRPVEPGAFGARGPVKQWEEPPIQNPGYGHAKQTQQHRDDIAWANGDGFQIAQKEPHHQHDIDFRDANGFQVGLAEIKTLNMALEEFFKQCRERCKGRGGVTVRDMRNIRIVDVESRETFSMEEMLEVKSRLDKLDLSGVKQDIRAEIERVKDVEKSLKALRKKLSAIEEEVDWISREKESITGIVGKLDLLKHGKLTIYEETADMTREYDIFPDLHAIMESVRREEYEHIRAQMDAAWKIKMQQIFETLQKEMTATTREFVGVDIRTYSELMTRYAACCPEIKEGGETGGEIEEPVKGQSTVLIRKGFSEQKDQHYKDRHAISCPAIKGGGKTVKGKSTVVISKSFSKQKDQHYKDRYD
ncbi:hypothetical protein Bbelb_378380 [Branchiostoma belcheri]|nr:hypothetical protein Bbelb_378380 [Branchiostoma belcheri]